MRFGGREARMTALQADMLRDALTSVAAGERPPCAAQLPAEARRALARLVALLDAGDARAG